MSGLLPRHGMPELSAAGVPAGPPVSDDLLNLLHAGGPDGFAAMLHQSTGLGALASSVPAAARWAGFGGLGLLMDAISDQSATGHLTSRVRIAGPCRYQIDHACQPRRGPVTIACDGAAPMAGPPRQDHHRPRAGPSPRYPPTSVNSRSTSLGICPLSRKPGRPRPEARTQPAIICRHCQSGPRP